MGVVINILGCLRLSFNLLNAYFSGLKLKVFFTFILAVAYCRCPKLIGFFFKSIFLFIFILIYFKYEFDICIGWWSFIYLGLKYKEISIFYLIFNKNMFRMVFLSIMNRVRIHSIVTWIILLCNIWSILINKEKVIR